MIGMKIHINYSILMDREIEEGSKHEKVISLVLMAAMLVSVAVVGVSAAKVS